MLAGLGDLSIVEGDEGALVGERSAGQPRHREALEDQLGPLGEGRDVDLLDSQPGLDVAQVEDEVAVRLHRHVGAIERPDDDPIVGLV